MWLELDGATLDMARSSIDFLQRIFNGHVFSGFYGELIYRDILSKKCVRTNQIKELNLSIRQEV